MYIRNVGACAGCAAVMIDSILLAGYYSSLYDCMYRLRCNNLGIFLRIGGQALNYSWEETNLLEPFFSSNLYVCSEFFFKIAVTNAMAI